MSDQSPRNTSTRTSLEVVTRRIVDQATAELAAYLDKLPESGKAPEQDTAAAATHDRVVGLRSVIDKYLGA